LADLEAATPLMAPAPGGQSPVDTIARVFPNVPRDVLRARLAGLLQVPETELDTRLAGVEDEVIFQLATNPALRERFAAPAPAAQAGGPPAAALPASAAGATLKTAPLSNRLRARLG
jgi:hypothetical protein